MLRQHWDLKVKVAMVSRHQCETEHMLNGRKWLQCDKTAPKTLGRENVNQQTLTVNSSFLFS